GEVYGMAARCPGRYPAVPRGCQGGALRPRRRAAAIPFRSDGVELPPVDPGRNAEVAGV
ncbi:MAG: hypothetical protein AVDCRST_MAG12-1538, partial [uncultured Rubrobacteraceae bacterium]